VSNAPDSYDLHGVGLKVVSKETALAARAAEMLGPFASPRPEGRAFRLHMRYGTPVRRVPVGLRKFWQGPLAGGLDMTYYCGSKRRLVVLEGHSHMDMDLAAGRAELTVAPRSEWTLDDGCVIPVVRELLSTRGQYMLHAACLALRAEPGAPAVMIAGGSGRGKTTTALALNHAGLEMLSDDVSFVVDAGWDRPLMAWGWALPHKVLAGTLELLDWLKDLPRRPGRQAGEWAFDPPSGRKPGPQVSPAAIFFLQQPNPRAHEITPLDKFTAVKLLTQENVRAFERYSDSPGGRAFQALARLAAQCKTYELSAGPDLDTLAETIAQLVA